MEIESSTEAQITVLPKRKLRKYTVRLEEGTPARLAELTGLDYNKAIRALVRHAINQLEKQASEQVDTLKRTALPDIDEALRLLDEGDI